VDTQGLADTKCTNAEAIRLIQQGMDANLKGVNYFVIVFKPGRMTDENREAIETIIKAFDLDNVNRKFHVYLLVSHCETTNEAARKVLTEECKNDKTISRLLLVNNTNLNFIGLPEPKDVNEWMYEGIMKWSTLQKANLMTTLIVPRPQLKPYLDGGCFCEDNYVELKEGKKLIRDLQMGDEVKTPRGFDPVIFLKDVLEPKICTKVGNCFLTENHLVYDVDGKLRLARELGSTQSVSTVRGVMVKGDSFYCEGQLVSSHTHHPWLVSLTPFIDRVPTKVISLWDCYVSPWLESL